MDNIIDDFIKMYKKTIEKISEWNEQYHSDESKEMREDKKTERQEMNNDRQKERIKRNHQFDKNRRLKKDLNKEIRESRKGKGMTTIFPLSGIFLFVVGGPIGWLIGLVLLFSVFRDNKKAVGFAISPFIFIFAMIVLYVVVMMLSI